MANENLYKLYVPGHPKSDKWYSEDELRQHLHALPYKEAAEARIWRNKMAAYVPVWKEFKWASVYAPDTGMPDTEDDIDISWLGLPEFLGGKGKWNSYTFSTICVPMVGVSGVGKTSLLVSMYTQLAGGFETDGSSTHNVVDETIIDLTKLTEGPKGALVEQTFSKGTEGRHDYHFKTKATGKDGNEYTQPFCFVDFGGGWFKGGESDPEVVHVLSKAPVSMFVVDTPALMSGKASIHQIVNRQTRIHDLYKAVVDSWRSTPRTVVFVLLKAERFIHDKRKAEMIQKLREHYGLLLELLYKNNVFVYATPVETAGGVEFDHYEEDGTPRFRYTGAGYKPKECEVPLKICLQRALSARIHTLQDRMDKKHPLVRWIQEKLLRRKYRQALDILTEFRRDSTLCDMDTNVYQLLPENKKKS